MKNFKDMQRLHLHSFVVISAIIIRSRWMNRLVSLLILLLVQWKAEAGALGSLQDKFVEGDWRYMSPILFCLILGLAFCIERMISLQLADADVQGLLARVAPEIDQGNIEGALESCKSTPGPCASLLHEGIRHMDQGLEVVEKAIITTGSVQAGKLEQGLIWISLFISLAPMLGFLGTVVGMIQAFDKIEMAGDISPTVVAGGIKVALLTTVFGLIVAIVLQIFYNYILSKIDRLVAQMETTAINLMDILRSSKNKPK